jgi:hypothetical protein
VLQLSGKLCVTKEHKHTQDEIRKDTSFWDWFYDVMYLIRTKLLMLWEKYYMIGFISRSATSSIIESRQPTFMLRFSDSVAGAVSIVFTDKNGNRDSFFFLKYTQIPVHLYHWSIWWPSNFRKWISKSKHAPFHQEVLCFWPEERRRTHEQERGYT